MTKGVSELEDTMVPCPPQDMRTGLLPTCPLAAEPLAVGVMSDETKRKQVLSLLSSAGVTTARNLTLKIYQVFYSGGSLHDSTRG